MQIRSVRLKNIKSHREAEFHFSPGINVLSGANGVGKSTVFEAIGYALFGVNAQDFVGNVERFLSIGTKKGEVSVTFVAEDGEVYRASRTVGTPSNWLLARESGGSFEVEEHARAEETERRIAGLLGLTSGRSLAEQFKLVIGPFQHDFLGPFVRRSPTERKKEFDRILGIDSWQETYRATSGLATLLKKEMERQQEVVRLLQEQVSVLPEKELELATVGSGLAEAESRLAGKRQSLAEVDATLTRLDAVEKTINSLNTDVSVLQGRINDGADKIGLQQARVAEAEQAAIKLEQCRTGREAFEAAEARLKELRQQEQARRQVEREIAALEKESAGQSQALTHERQEVEKTARLLAEEELKLAELRQGLQVDAAVLELAEQMDRFRQDVERLQAARFQLEGRRSGLVEGEGKLAQGSCPFLQQPCLNVGDNAGDVFATGIATLDASLVELGREIEGSARLLRQAEEAQRLVTANTIRLQELERQGTALAERQQKNLDREENCGKLLAALTQVQQKVESAKAELGAFAGLDGEIAGLERERTRLQPVRDAYALHEKDALDLPDRRRTLEAWQQFLDDLRQTLKARKGELAVQKETYEGERHGLVRREKDLLLQETEALRQQLVHLQATRQRLQGEVERLGGIQLDLEQRRQEIERLQEQEREITFLRNKVFRNVSSRLSERFRQEISQRADRIYRTIAEADEELVWSDGYQITLRDMAEGQIRERCDDQLSGGQIMSAVVALRLALLQTIGARIAFFDEPTSNLDAQRRENLAYAFRAIDAGRDGATEHWYDQLFLISHDTAFTEITDQTLHLGE